MMALKWLCASAVVLDLALLDPAAAQKKYGPGVTDNEIKIGQTMPYSGPVSAASVIGNAELAYFRMLNEQGGINGPPRLSYITRRCVLAAKDAGADPPPGRAGASAGAHGKFRHADQYSGPKVP
jgi:hypothetical protein